jgi:tetratricopeptide (TPR) repeat protein
MDEIQPAPASTEEADVAELDWIQSSDVSTEEAEPAEPVAIAADEGPEVEEPEAESEAEPIAEEPPAPEAKKKDDLLERSRQALASGDTASATEMYSDMIKRKESLESVIEDLRIAVDRAPDNADLWQVLGDAYMRDDQTDEAIDAYRKGMEAA